MWKDITMPLFNGMPNFPGDTPFQYRLDAMLQDEGANVGQVQLSLHIGTHVDAPYHYDTYGKAIDALPLELFIGTVLIIDATEVSEINAQLLEHIDFRGITRVFFKTRQQYSIYHFEQAYTVVTAEAIEILATQGIRVIGVDTPSVDAVDNSELTAHHACREAQMIIIENLFLKDVEEGLYEFIGLPLPIQGGDASPIRAVIQKKSAD